MQLPCSKLLKVNVTGNRSRHVCCFQDRLESSTAAALALGWAVGLLPSCTVRNKQRRTHNQHTKLAAQLTDRELTIKLSIAQSTDRLDLSGCSLTELPEALFQLTSLVDLSLAGNQITVLPHTISSLVSLRKLVLAGNWLQHLPEELWTLTGLEGLWVHGNLLQDISQDLGSLTGLRMLSLAGNRLPSIPDSVTKLMHLQDLNLSGNRIAQLPDSFCALTALTMLSLHGNELQHVTDSGWEQLQNLKEVTLQGNRLTGIPDSFAQLMALTELSLADNSITALPEDLSGWCSLQKFHCYSNQLTELPMGPRGLPALLPIAATTSDSSGSGRQSSRSQQHESSDSSYSDALNRNIRSVDLDENNHASGRGKLVSLWLEGNPLSEGCVTDLMSKMGPAGTTRIGLDQQQVAGAALQEYHQLKLSGNKTVRRGVLRGSGPGYFKLQLGPDNTVSAGDPLPSERAVPADRVLVVAFGSAPGLPNWGGVMRQVYAAAEAPQHSNFDVLYVVDPHRSWYCGGDPVLMQQRYGSRLQQYTQQYQHVVMIGDSMGATGALLFSPLATAVLAFCPQVDLTSASIRPGQTPEWQSALQHSLQEAVAASTASIKVFTGTWQHDIDQANLLSDFANVHVKVYGVDSHRLALALARQRKLAPIIREAVLGEMGITSGNVRLVNLL